MLNGIFIGLIAISVVFAAFNGTMDAVMQASIDSAGQAVTIAIGLLGMMALWIGVMRVLRDAGLMRVLARLLAPVMRRLFPEIPPEHPAIGAMILNISANMLGITNAATPFGLKAMQELETLNERSGVATNSMALFLAINTSGVAVMPLGAIAVRASLGSADPAGIFVPSILATACSTIAAIVSIKLLERRRVFAVDAVRETGAGSVRSALADGIPGMDTARETVSVEARTSTGRSLILAAFVVLVAAAILLEARTGIAAQGLWSFSTGLLSTWLLPTLMAGILLMGFARRVNVYESVIAGAREGFSIFVMIIPFLVAILVAVGMFRASGALEFAAGGLAAVTSIPVEAMVMALVRPLSGSGALGVMTEAMQVNGPDSFTGYLVSVMSGSTDTTFYVIALYFGSVSVRAGRHTVYGCLAADLTGFLAALVWCRLFFG